MDTTRLIIDSPASGAWNMAVDEVLLLSAARTRVSSLRFYTWEQPTVSIGYFQAVKERQQHSASLDCPLVRRTTGGGAIVHDAELTYSYCAPVADRVAPQLQHLSYAIHEAIIAQLRVLGIDATRYQSPAESPDVPLPFLCFQRRSEGDILVRDWKIVGSAQRRHKGAVLQHGSILLAKSRCAPELPGIVELEDIEFNIDGFVTSLSQGFDQVLRIGTRTSDLDANERAMVEEISESRFRSSNWTNRR